jgi:chromate transporter
LSDRDTAPETVANSGRAGEVLIAFLKLGLTSFGGPIAHVAYFRREFVELRKWIDETEFARLLALCQFLPGPASSKLGFTLGLLRGGWPGAFAAFAAFTLPSAVLLFAFAILVPHLSGAAGQAAIHGLKLVAVAVVAQAVPGPLFTLAAYLGARLPGAEGGIVGATVALIAIFLPGFLLIAGALPLWRSIGHTPVAARAVAGINAAVVGLLAAALYDPVWTSAVRGPLDVAIAAIAFTLLVAWRASALIVVLWCSGAAVAIVFACGR